MNNCTEEMTMPREQYVRSVELETENVGMLAAHLDTPQLHELAVCLVVYLASVFDLVAQRNRIYLNIGGTKAQDAFLLTEKGEAGNVYAGGENIVGFLEQIRDKLLTAEQAKLAAQISAAPPPRRK
jgi:hypothetical protein